MNIFNYLSHFNENKYLRCNIDVKHRDTSKFRREIKLSKVGRRPTFSVTLGVKKIGEVGYVEMFILILNTKYVFYTPENPLAYFF